MDSIRKYDEEDFYEMNMAELVILYKNNEACRPILDSPHVSNQLLMKHGFASTIHILYTFRQIILLLEEFNTIKRVINNFVYLRPSKDLLAHRKAIIGLIKNINGCVSLRDLTAYHYLTWDASDPLPMSYLSVRFDANPIYCYDYEFNAQNTYVVTKEITIIRKNGNKMKQIHHRIAHSKYNHKIKFEEWGLAIENRDSNEILNILRTTGLQYSDLVATGFKRGHMIDLMVCRLKSIKHAVTLYVGNGNGC